MLILGCDGMRLIGRALSMLAVMVVTGALVLVYPYLKVPPVQNSIEASVMLEAELRKGGDRLSFRAKDIDLDEVYAAMESRYPYAFSIHAATSLGGITELRVEVSRPKRQEQALGYAKTLAREYIDEDMTDEQKLGAIHDMLVRLCEYDTETAGEAAPDGATAPFAADGALIDHKAVCAGYGRAFGMLCEAAGMKAIYVSSEGMNHGWNAVRLNGATYFIDCTFDDPVPDRGEYVSRQYFLLTAEELENTHFWDDPFYERVLDSIA